MSYVRKALLPEEKIVYMGMLHWIVFIPGLMIVIAGGLLGLGSHGIASAILGDGEPGRVVGKALAGIALVVSLAGLFLSIGAGVRQSSTELAITNKRFIAKYGFISRTTFEIMINRVTGVNFDQSIWGRILGYGTVLIHGQGGDVSPFTMVANPKTFQHAVMRVLETVHARGP